MANVVIKKGKKEGELIAVDTSTGKIVGQTKISVKKSGQAVVIDIGVDADKRGQGIGDLLTSAAERYAKEHNATSIGALAGPEYLGLLKKRRYEIDGFIANKIIIPQSLKKEGRILQKVSSLFSPGERKG